MTLIRKLWYKWWHFWRGCPKPLKREGPHYRCLKCGWLATHGGDWGI